VTQLSVLHSIWTMRMAAFWCMFVRFCLVVLLNNSVPKTGPCLRGRVEPTRSFRNIVAKSKTGLCTFHCAVLSDISFRHQHSWKIVECMAEGGLFLHSAVQLNTHHFGTTDYAPTGRRGNDATFRIQVCVVCKLTLLLVMSVILFSCLWDDVERPFSRVCLW
jgi:hypothetical protein